MMTDATSRHVLNTVPYVGKSYNERRLTTNVSQPIQPTDWCISLCCHIREVGVM